MEKSKFLSDRVPIYVLVVQTRARIFRPLTEEQNSGPLIGRSWNADGKPRIPDRCFRARARAQ